MVSAVLRLKSSQFGSPKGKEASKLLLAFQRPVPLLPKDGTLSGAHRTLLPPDHAPGTARIDWVPLHVYVLCLLTEPCAQGGCPGEQWPGLPCPLHSGGRLASEKLCWETVGCVVYSQLRLVSDAARCHSP